MKKTIYILLGVSALLSLNSCFKEEDDIFSQSPAQRLNAAKVDYLSTLCAAEDGWVLEYFASESEQGYPLLMKFDEHTGVTIAAKNAVSSKGQYAEESSSYDVIDDDGSVLTFNTYNPLLHCFSDPGSNGIGHAGDYEFVILGMSDDGEVINLRGKKRGIETRLVKFHKAEGEGFYHWQNWEEYLTQIDNIKASMFSTKLNHLLMSASDGEYTLSGMGNGLFQFLREGGDAEMETETLSYIVRSDGTVHLVSPYTGTSGTLQLQNFRLGEDGMLHSADEGQEVLIKAQEPVELFKNKSVKWRINPDKSTGEYATLYQKVVADSKSVLNQTFNYFDINYYASHSTYRLAFKDGRYTGEFYIDITGTESIKFTYSGECSQTATGHLTNVPAYQEFLDKLTSTEYDIAIDSPLLPVDVTLTSRSNPSEKLVVNLN